MRTVICGLKRKHFAILKTLAYKRTREDGALIASLGVSRAKTLARLETKRALVMARGLVCGWSSSALLANFDPKSYSWKMLQTSYLSEEQELLQTLPRWGMTRGGELFRLQTWDYPTIESEYGLWRTATASDVKRDAIPKKNIVLTRNGVLLRKRWHGKAGNTRLSEQLLTLHTVKVEGINDWCELKPLATIEVNPLWVQMMMGFPMGYSFGKVAEQK